MNKHFIVNGRCVSTDSTLLIADNGDYTAVFAVDQEWMGRDITARFLLPDGSYCDAGLSDSLTCLIPPETLTASTVMVGIYSGEMATMPCRVQVCPSIKTGSAPIPDPEPSIYERLLAEVEAIHQNLEEGINDVY